MNLNATVINEKGYTNKEANERRGKTENLTISQNALLA